MKKIKNIDNSQYDGQHIAMKSFSDHEIISHGKNLNKVIKEAKNQGYDSPVLFFVPKKNMHFFF